MLPGEYASDRSLAVESGFEGEIAVFQVYHFYGNLGHLFLLY